MCASVRLLRVLWLVPCHEHKEECKYSAGNPHPGPRNPRVRLGEATLLPVARVPHPIAIGVALVAVGRVRAVVHARHPPVAVLVVARVADTVAVCILLDERPIGLPEYFRAVAWLGLVPLKPDSDTDLQTAIAIAEAVNAAGDARARLQDLRSGIEAVIGSSYTADLLDLCAVLEDFERG